MIATPDHPHAGGENNTTETNRINNLGPSPRGWGEQSRDRRCHRLTRTIPTRVGRTAGDSTEGHHGADHPHAGGENRRAERRSPTRCGPSPRGWGERCWFAEFIPGVRTIPTRVGRTFRSCNRDTRNADHPHAGGENVLVEKAIIRVRGPSPRGWGEPLHTRDLLAVVRTIPTRVGRTARPRCDARLGADHPHAGGENKSCQVSRSSSGGPSPRGWGEPHVVGLLSGPSRTIPTRVGRTAPLCKPYFRFSDHPHAGGENVKCELITARDNGPSPRGWGEQGLYAYKAEWQRTIPTRVGRTSPLIAAHFQVPDHPHAGGENCLAIFQNDEAGGPSPRGWGEPCKACETR